MLTLLGTSHAACDGVSRRQLLQAAGAGLLGLSVPRLLAAENAAQPARRAQAKSVIFLFLFGGPSQFETFDMKPDASAETRGPFVPIRSRTPGLLICEHLPKLAAMSDKYCVIRSMTHDFNDHSGGAHYIQTGKRWHVPIGGGFSPTPKDWPSMGSAVEYVTQRQPDGLSRELPSYVVLPNSLGRIEQAGQYPRPGEHAGWLGRQYNPLTTRINKRDLTDNPYWRDCTDEELSFAIQGLEPVPDLTLDRMKSRLSLLDQFDAQRRRVDSDPAMAGFDRFRQRAVALATSPKTREALNIRAEPADIRNRYGRHLLERV